MIARRSFITLLGGAAAAWPVAARGQQSAMPVVGFLHSGSSGSAANVLKAFHEGLAESGYVEGRNVKIEYRWSEDQNHRFPALVTELIQRRVNVIAVVGSPGVLAAQAATASIPIVFYVGVDPVRSGLVASLNRPGGNLTGVTNFAVEVGPKRLELVHELIGAAKSVGVLLNANRFNIETETTELQEAAGKLGLELQFFRAGTDRPLEDIFENFARMQINALIIGGDPYFNSRAEHLGTLALKHAMPAIYQTREFASAGGLLAYGSSFNDQYRLAGVYTGRVLKGEHPAELPVQQSTKLELIINLNTAKALGLTVPPALLARADEVIE